MNQKKPKKYEMLKIMRISLRILIPLLMAMSLEMLLLS